MKVEEIVIIAVAYKAKGNKVRIYKEYHSVCPLVGIGTLPPLSRQLVCLSPRYKRGGGHTRLRVRGLVSPNSDDLRKNIALYNVLKGQSQQMDY